MSELLSFAKRELALIRGVEPDEMQDVIEAHILHMVEEFSKEGHSGMSASYCIGILTKLLRFEPLTPLTGEPSEWNEVGENTWQNRRCSHVFKNSEDGEAYNIQGKVFVEPDGSAFTNFDSRVPVTFPYVPKIEYVQREASE